MSKEEYRAIRNQVQRLSTDEQFRLMEDLVAILKKKSRPQHSILELKGLGKEIWEGVDVDEYIRQIRGSYEPETEEQGTGQGSTKDLGSGIPGLSKLVVDALRKVGAGDPEITEAQEALSEFLQRLNSLQYPENADLQIRNIREKTTREGDS